MAETDTSSPISWIKSGTVDAVLDFRFPNGPSGNIDIPAILSDIASNISTAARSSEKDKRMVKGDQSGRVLGQKELARPALYAPSSPSEIEIEKDVITKGKVTVDIDLRFRDVKAAVPIWHNDLSVSHNALIRPIVAFMKCVLIGGFGTTS